jgi:methylated-DNA-[protein]-cysteine S-methyltransferase
MQIVIKYTIFKTKWGYFGLAGTEYGLLRTCLPLSSPEKVKSQLLTTLEAPRFEKRLFKTAQDQITSYFEGAYVNFADIPTAFDGLGDFCSSVLTACRGIEFGQVVTYCALAKKINRPTASRAIGNALAKNPLPLIIPCHRVIRNDGQPGGFSAPGGINTKTKLLKHEQQVLRNSKIK